MAAVVSYGTGPEPDIYRSMHSTSPPTDERSCSRKVVQNELEQEKNLSKEVEEGEAAIPCLDGATDQVKRNDAQIRGPLTKASAMAASANGTMSAFVIRQNSKIDEEETHTDDDNHNSRRKRRKISSEHDSRESTPKTNQHKTPSLISMKWLSGNPVTAESAEIDVGLPQNQTPREIVTDGHLLSAASHTTSQRRSPRVKRFQQTDINQQVETSLVDGSTSGPKVESQPSTSSTSSTKVFGSCQQGINQSQSSPISASLAETTSSRLNAEPGIGSKRNMKMKRGRLIQSLIVSLRYGKHGLDQSVTGQAINKILVSKPKLAEKSSTKPHPFFKARNMQNATQPCSTQPASVHGSGALEVTTDSRPGSKTPVAWSDIKFANQRSGLLKNIEMISPVWPPNWLQHIGKTPLPVNIKLQSELKDAERKPKFLQLNKDENILQAFATSLRHSKRSSAVSTPQRQLMNGQDAWKIVNTEFSTSENGEMMTRLRSEIIHGFTAFDRGEAAGQQSWGSKYAPICWKEVFQPSAETLHDWLRALAVHNVQSGLASVDIKQKVKQYRKKKRVKRVDDLDDFIVDDFDDFEQKGQTTKNAILITGPSGCGKTASVFAVARELGFEVFEIHPGMRRSTKDIFDKVGDMTQNHLVQNHDNRSRSPSVALLDTTPADGLQIDAQQSNISTFLASKKSRPTIKSKLTDDGASNRKEQKQSLILFEEVDILFEDDKGFWTGVQSLIQQSRRPVILTCNDVTRVPIEELDLHTILEFQTPSNDLVAEYLTKMAAAEGHLLQKQSLSALYASKGFDLRASIAELSFWCQMTVGSKQGGLDWMISSVYDRLPSDSERAKLRIYSKETFTRGLDLVPKAKNGFEEALQYAQDTLNLDITDWADPKNTLLHGTNAQDLHLKELNAWQSISDARSAFDIMSADTVPLMVSTIIRASQGSSLPVSREAFTATYADQINQGESQLCGFVDAFEPIAEEKPTFPPSQGRLAPSIDHENPAIALDIAPYVRSIVLFDKRTEQYREEHFGSQGQKTRTTRAARAAAEGSDKANTRSERWFPKGLDFEAVLRTSSDWPEWTACDRSELDSDIDMA